MRVVPLVVSACVVAGCDGIWDLTHVPELDAGADPACMPVDHDEDSDNIDDACDPCPFSADHSNDTDADGIPFACDPDPATPNVRLLFTGFDPMTRTALTSIGVGSYDDDNFRTSGSGRASLVWQGAIEQPVWFLAGVTINSVNGAAMYREVGVIYDAAPAPTAGELNGTMCVFGSTPTSEYLDLYARNRPAGDDSIEMDTSPSLIQANFDGVMRGFTDRGANPEAGCWFVMGNVEAGVTGTPDSLPAATGKLALYGTNLDASFHYLFVVGRP